MQASASRSLCAAMPKCTNEVQAIEGGLGRSRTCGLNFQPARNLTSSSIVPTLRQLDRSLIILC
jgi:hypothetical protein